jgi:hypothetical protein
VLHGSLDTFGLEDVVTQRVAGPAGGLSHRAAQAVSEVASPGDDDVHLSIRRDEI